MDEWQFSDLPNQYWELVQWGEYGSQLPLLMRNVRLGLMRWCSRSGKPVPRLVAAE